MKYNSFMSSNNKMVSPHWLASQVGSDIMKSGGNAIDAGVAAGLASNVIQSDMCNLGGVAPIILKQANSNKVWSISGVGTWSSSVTIN